MQTGKLNVLIILLSSMLLGGCNEIEMQSRWTEPFTLGSGDGSGWPEDPQYFDKDSKVLVSVMNDDTSLYIRLLSRSHASKMMFIRGGFTVWLNESGDTGEQFGLQFPLPRKKMMGPSTADHKSRNNIEDMLEDSQYSLAILDGPGETRQTMPTSKAAEMGIYARLGIQEGYLLYELKVPLIHSKDHKTIGLGFETGKIEGTSGRGSSGGGGGGGGKGGGGKGGGGKGGSKMGGNGSSHGGGSPKPIEIWAKVSLAEDASLTHYGKIKESGSVL